MGRQRQYAADSLPTFYYLYVDARADLRGKAVFEAMREGGLDVRMGEGAGTSITSGFVRVFAPIDGTAAFATAVEALVADHRTSVVLDVSFPITRPDRITGDDDGWWNDPEHRDNAFRALRIADGVTSSQPEWAADLAPVNSNTHCLPDLHLDTLDLDEDAAEQVTAFSIALAAAWNTGLRTKCERLGCHVEPPQESIRAGDVHTG